LFKYHDVEDVTVVLCDMTWFHNDW